MVLRFPSQRGSLSYFDEDTGHVYSYKRSDNRFTCVYASMMKYYKETPLSRKPCTARIGGEHNHPCIPRDVVGLILLRWSAMLELCNNPDYASPSSAFRVACGEWPYVADVLHPVKDYAMVYKKALYTLRAECASRKEYARVFAECFGRIDWCSLEAIYGSEQVYWGAKCDPMPTPAPNSYGEYLLFFIKENISKR